MCLICVTSLWSSHSLLVACVDTLTWCVSHKEKSAKLTCWTARSVSFTWLQNRKQCVCMQCAKSFQRKTLGFSCVVSKPTNQYLLLLLCVWWCPSYEHDLFSSFYVYLHVLFTTTGWFYWHKHDLLLMFSCLCVSQDEAAPDSAIYYMLPCNLWRVRCSFFGVG